MKILVNATPLLSPWTGIGQYIHNLFTAMQQQQEAELHMAYGLKVVRGYTQAPTVGAAQAPWLRQLALKVLPNPRATKRMVEELMFRHKTRHGLRGAIYHEPNYLPMKFEGPLVLTVCDMSCFDHPETHPKERVQLMEQGMPSAIERADHILHPLDRDHAGVDRLAARRHLVEPRNVHFAILRQSKRARDRGGGHRQTVRGALALLGQHQPLAHPEAVLLVDHDQREIAIGHAVLKDRVGAHADLDRAVHQPHQDRFARAALVAPGQQRNGDTGA